MADGIGTSVSRVVHDKCALLHLLTNQSSDVRIAVARSRTDTRIGIPHDAFYQDVRVQRLYQLGHAVGILHVAVLVAVVTHKTKSVLPDASFLVIDIAVDFVNNNLSIGRCSCRDASDGNVRLFRQQTGSFVVVQQSEVVVANVTTGMTV